MRTYRLFLKKLDSSKVSDLFDYFGFRYVGRLFRLIDMSPTWSFLWFGLLHLRRKSIKTININNKPVYRWPRRVRAVTLKTWLSNPIWRNVRIFDFFFKIDHCFLIDFCMTVRKYSQIHNQNQQQSFHCFHKIIVIQIEPRCFFYSGGND